MSLGIEPASAEIISYKYVGTLSGYSGSPATPATIYVQYDLDQARVSTGPGQTVYLGGSQQYGTPGFATGYFTLNGVTTHFSQTASASIDATDTAFSTDFFVSSGLPSPLTSVYFSLNSYHNQSLGEAAAFSPGTYTYNSNDSIGINTTSGSQGHGFYDVTLTIAEVGNVSGVPLPASAPMFGAALLAFGVVGYGVKRRTIIKT